MKKQLIFFTSDGCHVHYKALWLIFLTLSITLSSTFYIGRYSTYLKLSSQQNQLSQSWQTYLTNDRAWLRDLKSHTEQHLGILNEYAGSIQANLLKIDVLTQSMVQSLNITEPEFNLKPQQQPILKDTLLNTLQKAEVSLENRYTRLCALNNALQMEAANQETYLKAPAKPVKGGWLSSHFGTRKDPFTGRLAWHAGVDIAGDEGSVIKALASGIVSFAEHKGGYGRLIEINHGEGLSTRYAHTKKLLVKAGELVYKDQPIALLGSSGRSTGPHLHLEVHHQGQAVDPSSYFPEFRRRS